MSRCKMARSGCRSHHIHPSGARSKILDAPRLLRHDVTLIWDAIQPLAPNAEAGSGANNPVKHQPPAYVQTTPAGPRTGCSAGSES